MNVRRILVAADIDETAERVVGQAAGLAHQLDAELIVVHIVPEEAIALPEVGAAAALGAPSQGALDHMLHGARARLEGLVDMAASKGIPVRSVLVTGDPASAILDQVTCTDADMAVVGTHGRRGLARVLLGSVAEAVLRRSPVPTLVVRTAPNGD